MHPLHLAQKWGQPHLPLPTEDLLARLLASQPVIPSKQPIFIHMLGVPGSGKTTQAHQLHTQLSAPFFWLDADLTLQALSHFHTDKIALGALAASLKWELPARALTYRLLHTLVEQRLPVLFDNGGSSADHLGLLQWVQQQGYHTVMFDVPTPPHIAQQRVAARNAAGGRAIPLSYITERQPLIDALRPQYAKIVDLLTTNPEDIQAFVAHAHTQAP